MLPRCDGLETVDRETDRDEVLQTGILPAQKTNSSLIHTVVHVWQGACVSYLIVSSLRLR